MGRGRHAANGQVPLSPQRRQNGTAHKPAVRGQDNVNETIVALRAEVRRLTDLHLSPPSRSRGGLPVSDAEMYLRLTRRRSDGL